MLRQRLRGPTLAAYYPRKVATLKDLQNLYPAFEVVNDAEEDRLNKIKVYVDVLFVLCSGVGPGFGALEGKRMGEVEGRGYGARGSMCISDGNKC